jgi:hypothetical protein
MGYVDHNVARRTGAAAVLTDGRRCDLCPPGEGMILEIDKIFWRTKQAS